MCDPSYGKVTRRGSVSTQSAVASGPSHLSGLTLPLCRARERWAALLACEAETLSGPRSQQGFALGHLTVEASAARDSLELLSLFRGRFQGLNQRENVTKPLGSRWCAKHLAGRGASCPPRSPGLGSLLPPHLLGL